MSQAVARWEAYLMCMRTNIEIDDEVIGEAQRLIGARTKRETVDTALRGTDLRLYPTG